MPAVDKLRPGYNGNLYHTVWEVKEAATEYNPMYTPVAAAPVILVVSYGTTRLLSNSPAHSPSRSLTPD